MTYSLKNWNKDISPYEHFLGRTVWVALAVLAAVVVLLKLMTSTTSAGLQVHPYHSHHLISPLPPPHVHVSQCILTKISLTYECILMHESLSLWLYPHVNISYMINVYPSHICVSQRPLHARIICLYPHLHRNIGTPQVILTNVNI